MLEKIKSLFGPREYKRLIFEQSKRRWDKWETDDSEGYELYLRIYAVKRKGERGFYQIEVPNYSICTHRLLHGLWEIMLHIDGSGPAISRLEDHYDKLVANYRKVSNIRQAECAKTEDVHNEETEEVASILSAYFKENPPKSGSQLTFDLYEQLQKAKASQRKTKKESGESL